MKPERELAAYLSGQNTLAIRHLQYISGLFKDRAPTLKKDSKDTEQTVFTAAEQRGEDLFSKCNYSN